MNDDAELDRYLMDDEYNFDLHQAFGLLSETDLLSEKVPSPDENKQLEGGRNEESDSNETIFSSKGDRANAYTRFNSLEYPDSDKLLPQSSTPNTFTARVFNSLEYPDTEKAEPESSSAKTNILHWAGKVGNKSSSNVVSRASSLVISTESFSNGEADSPGKKRAYSDITIADMNENKDSGNIINNNNNNNKKNNNANHNSDNDDDDDDDDGDGDEDEGNSSKVTSRPNVREHSKAQREKRKGNISGLERQARELTNDLNDMNCQFISALETCRAVRQRHHRTVLSFLKLWINDQSTLSEGGHDDGGTDINRQPVGNILGFEARKSKWAALFSSSGAHGSGARGRPVITCGPLPPSPLNSPVTMTLPCTFSRFSPPMNAHSYISSSPSSLRSSESVHISFDPDKSGGTGTKSSRLLSSLADIIADSTSLAVMCQNISEFGPVQICHFTLGIDVPLDGFISEDLVVIAPFYMYSKNATMCGGKFEIDLKGYVRCEFNSQGLIERVELSYDDWHLTEQLLESFGPSIYRPYSDISLGDEDFHMAENRQSLHMVSGRDLSMARVLHLEGDNHVFPRVNNKHVVPKLVPKNSHMDECRVITNFSTDCIVEAINSTAFEQFGQITGRSLISADWMTEALALLAQWAPYVCSLNTVRSSPETGGPTTETKCLLFPMYDKVSSGGVAASTTSCQPNKICWVIFNHNGYSHEKQLETIIQQFLHGTVTKFAAKLNNIGSSCYFLSFMTLLSQAELILQCDSDEEDDDDEDDERGSPPPPQVAPSQAGREKDLKDFLGMLADFLKWMTALESKIWSEENPLLEVFFFNAPESSEYCDHSTRLSRMSLMELEKSSNVKKPTDPFSLSKGLAPNSQALSSSFSSIIDSHSSVSSRSSSRSSSISDAEEEALHDDNREWTLFMEFLDDINSFFTMLRQSHVSKHIVSLLKTVSTTRDYLLLEELNAHCLTKHMNGRICFLMKHAKDLIQQQEFERAVETLSEIISLDPSFIEAYNRRATALFGLHRAQECFSDLEFVLRANPLHYGALCGKGLLSMNLKAFAPAAECFEKALSVNPMLAQDDIIQKSIALCKQSL